MAEHQTGKPKAQFCATRCDTNCSDCDSSQNYREICDEPKNWNGYQAHHIVCCTSVKGELVANEDVKPVIAQTKWCINKKSNMIAMPVWGHTVMWYCNATIPLTGVAAPPSFVNIPQHNADHNGDGRYTWEVTQACKALAKKVAKKEHELATIDLAAALDQLSVKFRNILLSVRGTRQGGTHAAWQKGMADPQSAWCYPFSMSSTVWVTKVAFPLGTFDSTTRNWMKNMVKALTGG